MNGYPVVEVLKNGGPVHSFDSNFRFGVRKAQMLLACVHILREFCPLFPASESRPRRRPGLPIAFGQWPNFCMAPWDHTIPGKVIAELFEIDQSCTWVWGIMSTLGCLCHEESQ